MTPAELQVVPDEPPTYVRDEVLERILEERCSVWEFVPELELDTLDVAASLANQARLESLNEEAVERYQADMERGDIFPPILVHRRKTKRGEKLVILGGNHRTAAARKAKRKHLSAYVIEADGDAVLRLMYEDNRRHGLPPTDEERVMAAQHLMEIGDTIHEAARAVGLGIPKLRQHLDVVLADQRAAQFSLPKWRALPLVHRYRLGQIRYDRVFEKAARLTSVAKLRQGEVFDLVTLVNGAETVTESLDRLTDHRKLLGNRVRGEEEQPGRSTTAKRKLISAMQEIRMIDPLEAAEGFTTADQRNVVSEQIKDTARILQRVLQRIDG